MYGRISCLLLLLAFSFVIAGCKKDTEVNAVIADLDAFTKELVQKVEGAQNPSAGIDDAQKFLDARKADMRAKIESLKGMRGYQVSKETTAKITESVTEDVMSVNKLKIKFMSNTMRDPALKAKLDKLVEDYNALLKM
ncbi:MAG TPA: hypothetical protein VEX60_07310 [Pyrinomonadaceae bacterium]|nr:hypothetical protein [Pyrinomonadaceae bacterium]